MIKTLLLIFIVLVFPKSYAQQKMDLDDLDIKGDLMNDNRIQMINREKHKLKNYVEYRTNFRKEIIEDLDKPFPKYKID